jgi:hypothetical protein
VHPVTPLNGGNISGIAEANNGNYLVVTYNDGSIQSFSTPASGAINPTCATAIDSTGFLNQGSMPAGVDITNDGRYAVFGDISGPYPYGPTELETIKVPISCTATTKDFGGTAVASSTHLGSFSNSENVWISPDDQLIYVSNNGPFSPKGLTSVNYSETTDTMSLVSGCTAGHTNPTALAPPLSSGTFFSPRGIQTSATSGNGAYVYVAEYYGPEPPSAVALLDVDTVGCTKEHLSGGHPFSDPDGTGGASNVSAMPPRPF